MPKVTEKDIINSPLLTKKQKKTILRGINKHGYAFLRARCLLGKKIENGWRITCIVNSSGMVLQKDFEFIGTKKQNEANEKSFYGDDGADEDEDEEKKK